MAFADFIIRDNPEDTPQDITKKIIYSLFVRRIRNNKPCIIFVSGESGEGKSWSVLTLQKMILEMFDKDIKDYINDINIYLPTEFPTKFNNILYSPRMKGVHVLAAHEARELVPAKLWNSFVTQAIASILNIVRAKKRLITIIVSQFIRDITTDIRFSLHYYISVYRPMDRHFGAQLRIYRLWKDDRDIEKPQLKKRMVSGFKILANGKYQSMRPKYLELKKPDKELRKIMDEADLSAKKIILDKKIQELMREFNKVFGMKDNKMKAMIEWYSGNLDHLPLIGKMHNNKFKVKKELAEMHGLDKDQLKEFQIRLTEKLKENGVIVDGSNAGYEPNIQKV